MGEWKEGGEDGESLGARIEALISPEGGQMVLRNMGEGRGGRGRRGRGWMLNRVHSPFTRLIYLMKLLSTQDQVLVNFKNCKIPVSGGYIRAERQDRAGRRDMDGGAQSPQYSTIILLTKSMQELVT